MRPPLRRNFRSRIAFYAVPKSSRKYMYNNCDEKMPEQAKNGSHRPGKRNCARKKLTNCQPSNKQEGGSSLRELRQGPIRAGAILVCHGDSKSPCWMRARVRSQLACGRGLEETVERRTIRGPALWRDQLNAPGDEVLS